MKDGQGARAERARASWPTPIPQTELDETKAKASALLPAVAPASRTIRSTRPGAGPGEAEAPMILVVDHYDSFTYNLVQLIEKLGHRHRGRQERR